MKWSKLGILKNSGIQIFLIIIIYLSLAGFLPLFYHRLFYTISLFIRDLLIWTLPIIISLFIAHTVSFFEKKAPFFILFILLFEFFSNFCCAFYSYFSGHLALGHLPAIKVVSENFDFDALWRLSLAKPAWWSADKGVILGLILGCLGAFSKSFLLKNTIGKGKELAQLILGRLFSRLIPLFILGFIAKMYQTKMLSHIFLHYSVFLIYLVIFLSIYITALFILGSGFSLVNLLRSIKNLLPAGGIAFSSSCSLSTMPWTIEGAAKNLKNPDFARAIIPATTNIQQVGDCITNAFLCFLLYSNFFGHSPDPLIWLKFSIIFALARFATAAVLGGAIFIMLPIYETYLSFNGEMIAIILAFNLILDPLITCCNVVGNGAMCSLYEKVWNFLNRGSPRQKKENP